MEKTWWYKLAFLIFIVITSSMYVFPTLANLDLDKTHFPIKKKVNLGLDLQGGLYMVYGIDFNKVYNSTLDRQMKGLQNTLSAKTIEAKAATVSNPESNDLDPRFKLEFAAAQKDAIYKMIKSSFNTLRLVGETATSFDLGLSTSYKEQIRDNTLGQSIQVIRNRIDQFGVSEPAISSQGDSRVVVELPGVKEIDRAKELIGRTAKLEFRIVNEQGMKSTQLPSLVAQIVKENNLHYKEGQRFSDFSDKVNALAKSKIPADSEIAFERIRGGTDSVPASEQNYLPYLLLKQADVTGQDLQDAQVSFDPETHRPLVAFELTPGGAGTFSKLTAAHKGERLAIVLDNIVHSAPVIQSEIGGRGQITLGHGDGEQMMKEAKDLAIVLRAGALPAQLELLEQRVIGPTLGQDSIKRGITAGVVGCIFVFVFMVFYYRMSGVVAVVSLILNGLIAFAVLVGIDATLTLPGIAGLALTIGMAVDSNVIIFERIRDELEEGKSAVAAVPAGFQKAFSSIFDANITHAIVALVLLNFGTGPIKGFAVTLLIGIGTTLFTAVTVCKLIFDGYIHMKQGKIDRLSI